MARNSQFYKAFSRLPDKMMEPSNCPIHRRN